VVYSSDPGVITHMTYQISQIWRPLFTIALC